MILIILQSHVKAFATIECIEEEEGFKKAECYLDDGRIHEYFNYVYSFYEEAKHKEEPEYNPSLAFRFVEKVVKEERYDLGEIATELYFWSLNADEVEPHKELLEREVKYLSALMDSDENEELLEMVHDNDPAVYDKIRSFWKSRDVVISSDTNERLLEHWERILHSKDNFTENDTTVYGTDERADIYIRLGQPNDKRTGRFGTSRSEIRAKLYDLQDKGLLPDSPTAMFNMQQEILTSVTPAEYELWQYDNLSEYSRERIFFLFGRDGGRGSYGLRDSVEDFLPSEVFSRALGDRSRGNDIRIGNFLQFMYYNDLSTFNIFFGNQLEEYDRAWHRSVTSGSVNSGQLRSSISRQRARMATQEVYDRAPGDTSTYERHVPAYDLDFVEYRFLNEDKDPEVIAIITSAPDELYDNFGYIQDNQGQKIGEREYDIHIRQGISQFGDDDSWIDRNMNELSKVYQSKEGINKNPFTSHNLLLADKDNYAIAFSEMYFGELGDENNPERWALVGMKKNEPKEIPKLEHEPGKLLLSDIVLGSTEADTVSIRDESIGILKNGNKVNQGEDLQVYFESYYFDDDERDYVNYEVEYSIESSGRSWWPFSSSTEQSLTWEASADGWRDAQFFEVEHDDLDEGSYTLNITVTENETGRQATRNVDFEVIKSNEE